MKAVLYARVSTDDKKQYPETQLFAMRKFCADADYDIVREYVDHARARDNVNRKAWQQLQKDGRQHKFKVVVVFRLDRAFRSVRDCTNVVEGWLDHGIMFRSMSEDVIDTSTSQGRFILQIMAAIAELESAIISDRVTAGMARAKAEGRPLGRKSYPIAFTIVCKAIRTAAGNYSAAARALAASAGHPVSPAFVQMRVQRAGLDLGDIMGLTDEHLGEMVAADVPTRRKRGKK